MASRRRLGEIIVWFVGLILFSLVLLLLINPIIECLWVEVPPPLVFMNHWQISVAGVVLLLSAITLLIWANVLLSRISLKA